MKSLKGILGDSSPVWKLCQFLLLMLLCTVVAIGLWTLLYHGRQDVVSLKVMQMLQTVGTFMLPCFIMAYFWSKHPMEYLGLSECPDKWTCLLAVVLMLLASPGINLLSWLNQQMRLPAFLSGLEMLMQQQEEAAALLTEQFIRADSVGVLLFNLVLMALLPAFGEELCFRGVVQRLFSPSDASNSTSCIKAGQHAAVWATAILFSAIHFQFYGFVPRMLMGALLGYMLVWSGSLWLPVLAHFTNNALAVIVYNIYYMRGMDTDGIDVFGTGSTSWVGILSLLLAGACIFYLYRRLIRVNTASLHK